MTEQQQAITDLLVEIDKICRENDIVYYISGGSTLGAVRHRGFIPWDDDADVLMTRENWERFRAVVKGSPRPWRALVTPEDHKEYNQIYPQYKDTSKTVLYNSCSFCSFPMGAFVDILILDPVPDDRDLRERHAENLRQWGELQADRYVVNRDSNYRIYLKNYRCAKKQGRDTVIEKIKNEVTQYDDDGFCSYVQRISAYPVVIDRRFIGKPQNVHFEGHIFYTFSDYYGYLRWAYGDSWMMLPTEEQYATHNLLYNNDLPSHIVRKNAEFSIDKERITKAWRHYKQARFEAVQYEDGISQFRTRVSAVVQAQSVIAKIDKAGVDPLKVLREGDHQELEVLFDEYYRTQLSPTFVKNQCIIKLSEENLYSALMILIYRGEYYHAAKIMDLYYHIPGELHNVQYKAEGMLAEVQQLWRICSELSVICYDRHDWKAAEKLVDEWLPQYPCATDFVAAKMMLLLRESNNISNAQRALEMGENILRIYPDCQHIKKFIADALAILGKKEEAEHIWDAVYCSTRNGMLRLCLRDEHPELTEKWDKIAEKVDPDTEDEIFNCSANLEKDSCAQKKNVELEYEEQWKSAQDSIFDLLVSFDRVCRKNDIPYFLGGYLAAQAIELRDFAPESISAYVLLHPADRQRLCDAINVDENKSSRFVLESFESASDYPDYSMRYVDTSKTLLFLNESGFYENNGMALAIFFVRPYSKSKWIRKLKAGFTAATEACVFPSISDNMSRKKVLAGVAGKIMTGVLGKKNARKIMWKFIFEPQNKNKKIFGSIKSYWRKESANMHLDFSEHGVVMLRGHEFPIPTNYEGYISVQTSSTWLKARSYLKLIGSIYDMTLPCENLDRYLKDNYKLIAQQARMRKKLNEINRSVSASNHYINYSISAIRFTMDRFRLWQKYMPMKAELIELDRNGEYGKLRDILGDCIDTTFQYLPQGLALAFDVEIFRIMWQTMEHTGEEERMLELVGKVTKGRLMPITLACGRRTKMKQVTQENEISRILEYLYPNLAQCLYMYVDIKTYGISNPNMMIWYEEDSLGICTVVMKYHSCFQVFANRGFENTEGIYNLAYEYKPSAILGCKKLIESLNTAIKQKHVAEYGVVFKSNPVDIEKRELALKECEYEIELAEEKDALAIAKTLYLDPEYAANNSLDGLADELAERIRTGMGRSYIIRDGDTIVAHNASYAECDEFVVVGGLMVHPDYRHTDSAYWIETKSSMEFYREGKDRYFFATNSRVIRWHRSIGSMVVAEYGKLLFVWREESVKQGECPSARNNQDALDKAKTHEESAK